MKKLILLLTFLWAGTMLTAQDFTISGYVTNANGGAINNFQVCVNTPTSSNNPFSGCVFTNPNGWYTITIPNGAITGSNQIFYVSIVNCDSTLLTDTVSNNQGTIHAANVDFVYCQQTVNCNAAFTYQVSGLTVSLTPTMANTTATYTWSFGDGTTSSQYHPVHTYTAAGTYTVCLYVSAGGCTDSTCQTIVVGNNNPCNVNFTYSAANTPPNTIQFTGTSSPGITTTQWLWDFGDGHTVTGQQHPTHTYAAPGSYIVCVQIKDIGTGNVLCSNCDSIVVGNITNCQASFTHTVTPNGAHVFTGNFTPATTATGWVWNFGDSTTATGQTVTHHFTTPGAYNVCLTVTSTNCPAVTYCQTITVSAPPVTCNANFTYQQSGATVHFYNNNSGLSPSLTMNYYWDFGNGSSSNLVNPSHTYTVPGTYTVCLTVSDSLNNCYDQYCQTIVIGNNTTCQASFTYTYGSVYNAAFFGNFSPMSNSVQWHWDFGDSTTSNLQNPIHHFPGPGTYNVCLTVTTTTSNCPSVTYCQTITIQGGPVCNAYFTYQVNNANVYFHTISSSNATTTTFAWDFGDGNTSNLPNPVHSYLNYGTYTVCLTVTDSLSGCTDTFCQTITIGNSGGFGGQVFAGTVGADMGTVYLLSVVPNPNALTNSIVPVASTVIDSGGYYLFQNIPYGNYLVQAHLDPASTYFFDYLPTYYGDVLYWSQATFVSVGQYGLTVQYDINLISAVSLNNGNGQISGGISLGTGNKSITDIENVMVVLLDEYDIPLKHTYSNAYGYFEFTNLPYGTYKVFAEIWGKEPIAATVSLDDANPTVDNIHITINEDNVVASIEALFDVYLESLGNLYPNPASDLINIEMFAKQNVSMQFSIYNIHGLRVAYAEWTVYTGANRFSINVGDLSDGIYFVSLTAGNRILHTKKFSIIK